MSVDGRTDVLEALGAAPPSRAGKWALFVWGALRFPALLAIVYFAREWFFATGLIDVDRLTLLVIQIAGSPLAFLIMTLLVAGAFALIHFGAFRLAPVLRYVLTLLAAGAFTFVLFRFNGLSTRLGLPAMVLLAANLYPDALLPRALRSGNAPRWIIGLAVGFAEIFAFGRFLGWLADSAGVRTGAAFIARAGAVAGCLFAGATVASNIAWEPLLTFEQSVRMPSHARVMSPGDFNGLALDGSGRYLFATGHGIPNLLRFDLDAPAGEPLAAPSDTGNAQGLAYDAAANELYVFHAARQEILVLDAATLAVKRNLPVPGLSPGDPWIVADGMTGTLTIASEADIAEGDSFIVLDRATGAVLDRRKWAPGNLLLHPREPVIYMTFFRGLNSVMAYDLLRRDVTAMAETSPRLDRLAFSTASGELLLAAPAESRLLRTDPATLAVKGSIPSLFGARTIAFDDAAGLMFVASLATGEVEILDAGTGKAMKRMYLGPWLRSISVAPSRKAIYVSSNGSLYEVRYDHIR